MHAAGFNVRPFVPHAAVRNSIKECVSPRKMFIGRAYYGVRASNRTHFSKLAVLFRIFALSERNMTLAQVAQVPNRSAIESVKPNEGGRKVDSGRERYPLRRKR